MVRSTASKLESRAIMIVMKTKTSVKGISGKDVSEFMLNCTDDDYQKWWAGTHLAFHTIKRFPNNLGNLVYFDEYIGRHRLRLNGVVTGIVPGEKLEWQMKKIISLPAWLTLNFVDNKDGVTITHTMSVGFKGLGRIIDPILSRYFSKSFEKEVEEHVQIEFHKLAEILA